MANTGAIQKAAENRAVAASGKPTMQGYIKQMEKEIAKALPSVITPERFTGPWQTNFEEMAKKTVLKRVLKYAPLKSEFVHGVSCDNTIKTEISEDMYAAPTTYIDVEGEAVDVDEQTGEVLSDV